MTFVLDASVSLAWCFDDTTDPLADHAETRLATGEDAVVPSLWRLEVANVLVLAERRRRLTEADTFRFLSLLEALPIRVAPDFGATPGLIALAREHGLTAYDAAYLETALRLGLPLATLDRRLAQAARTAGAILFTPQQTLGRQ